MQGVNNPFAMAFIFKLHDAFHLHDISYARHREQVLVSAPEHQGQFLPSLGLLLQYRRARALSRECVVFIQSGLRESPIKQSLTYVTSIKICQGSYFLVRHQLLICGGGGLADVRIEFCFKITYQLGHKAIRVDYLRSEYFKGGVHVRHQTS
ncbi:hypothetical protein Q5Y75_08375 [Ruegeria sp. 2205SS24-7]|uniref:hypothetical protein n=1 Tax=Ruegeria discodermiae TaxID=3064389 RepID=UPI00274032E2|nr:hypothetical protein [Ruegeria sp. 2205SS24-7]MDP5217230.1 hypothetical protein [Ruegeria sp. 2205SS24-7]